MGTSLETMITSLPAKLSLKARSLLMTVWGDSVSPHGGTVWLGSLIDLVSAVGLNERVVRTSVFRLKQDKLLSSHQEGRRSYYTLTTTGEHRFEEATKRIYTSKPKPWDAEWTLLFSERRHLSEEQKKALSNELSWLGFGDLGSGIYAHPNGDQSTIEHLLADLGLCDNVAILKASNLPNTKSTPVRILVQKGWNLEEIEGAYSEFISHFAPIMDGLKQGDTLDNKKCFILRTLLVHDYRRALLRDPMLPQELLWDHWKGNTARDLFHDIYQLIWESAEEYLLATLESDRGKLPTASEEFKGRFGGLILGV
ncbi:MAG: phenylacetic acid degradation operon negative regulatory protein PaaX [Sneathiella sp.]